MSLWNFMYQNQIKNIVDLVSRTDGDAGYANLNAIARIFKVYLFSILTDVYGDIPYFAAGTAYFSKDYYPKYDKQQFFSCHCRISTTTSSTNSTRPSKPSAPTAAVRTAT